MRKGRIVNLVTAAAAVMISLTLAGCSKDSSSKTASDTGDDRTESGEGTGMKGETPSYLNEEGFPIVKEPITLKIFVSQGALQPEFQDIYLLQKYEEMTGIHIEWVNVPKDTISEKRALAMSSNEMPDIFLKTSLGSVDQLKYGMDGAILDLNKDGMLQKYAPNFWAFMNEHPDVMQSQMQPNGAIYSIPAAADSPSTRINRKIFYNQKWLDKLGLKQPTTSEELYQVLKAFKTQDPNGNGREDEIPIAQTPENLYQSFMGMFGLMNRGVHNAHYDVDEKSGAVRHIRTAPEYREMLTYMNRLYQEGLIDQEFLTYKDQVAAGYVAQDRLGVYISTNLAVLPKEAEQMFVAGEVPWKGPNGDQLWPSIRSHLHSTGAFVISADCKYPEAALRWADYFYSDEGILFYHYGIEGDTYVKNSDGSYSYSERITSQINESASFDQVVSQYTPYGFGNNPTIMKAPYFSGMELAPIPSEAADNLMPYTPKEVWPFFTYTVEENKVLSDLTGPLNKHVSQTSAEFVTGQRPLDDKNWNEYVNIIQDMGLAKVLEIQEAAYARIK